MLEYKWCIIEVENAILEHGWEMKQIIHPKPDRYWFRKWIIEKDEKTQTLEFFHALPVNGKAVYVDEITTYACKVKNTNIGLEFLEYHQKQTWMTLLEGFVLKLDSTAAGSSGNSHDCYDMGVREAMDIVRTYINENPNIDAEITHAQWISQWRDGNNELASQAWIISADNLKARMDGAYFYSFIVDFDSKKVVDIQMS